MAHGISKYDPGDRVMVLVKDKQIQGYVHRRDYNPLSGWIYSLIPDDKNKPVTEIREEQILKKLA